MALVSDFMAFKLSPGFGLATELHEPDSVLSVAVMGLVEKFPSVSPDYILAIGGSLLNNAGAIAAAWALGRIMAWAWGI